jgi:hypothetical protein
MRTKLLVAAAALILPAAMAAAQAGDAQAGQEAAPPAGGAGEGGQVQAQAATAADLTAGATISDPSGQPVGTIDSVSDTGVVLKVGERKIQIPTQSVGKNERGLLIPISRTELEAVADKAAGGTAGADAGAGAAQESTTQQ